MLVTGLVLVPKGTAPKSGWPVVSWAHPTDGMNGPCAPSLDPSADVPLANSLLGNGWEVTATDYQGEASAAFGKSTAGLCPTWRECQRHATPSISSAPLTQVLTSKGTKELPILGTQCLDAIAATLVGFGYNGILKVTTLPAVWQTVVDENDPESFTTASTTPLLIVQGSADTLVLPTSSQALATHLCDLKQSTERWVYPGFTHDTIVQPASMGDMVQWMADRFAGKSNPDPYKPTGLAGIQATSC